MESQSRRSVLLLRAAVCRHGQSVALPAFGVMLKYALRAGEVLDAAAVNMPFVKPLDETVGIEMVQSHDLLAALNEPLLLLGSRTPALNLRLLDGSPVQGRPPGAPRGLRSGYARQTGRHTGPHAQGRARHTQRRKRRAWGLAVSRCNRGGDIKTWKGILRACHEA